MTKCDLADCILGAIRSANLKYQCMSGGSWLSDYGVESYLVAHMAEALTATMRKVAPLACVSLEERFVTLKEYSEASGVRGRVPQILGKSARCDLALWRDYQTLYGAIEVKRKWESASCLKDLERLWTLMDRYGEGRGGRLTFACFAVFVAKAQDADGKKVRGVYSHIRQTVAEHGYDRVRFSELAPEHYDSDRKRFPANDPDDSYQDYSFGGMTIELY